MRTQSLLGITLALLVMVSCKQSEEKTQENTSVAAAEEQSTSADSFSANANPSPSQNLSSKAAVGQIGEKRKFVRTADIQFKVKDVAKSTSLVEDVVSEAGGFVVSTDLKSEIESVKETKKSEDSIVKTTQFTVHNDMVIRVPNSNLDAALRTISKEVGFLDYRIIKAEDVNLQLKSDELTRKRLAHHQERLASGIDAKGNKLSQIAAAENDLLAKQESRDNATLHTLDLEDRIAYSTVALKLYQDKSVRRETLENPEYAGFRTPFTTKVADSLKTGWYILEGILTFLLNFWPFLIVGLLAYFGFKRYAKKTLAS